MLRTVIIDDEEHARDTLRMLVEEYCPQVRLIGEAGGVETGVRLIRETHPDLLLLDIQLTDGSGFDLLARLSPLNFRIIFITAYDQYALQAFKFSAVDYLLKPVSRSELVDAVERATQLIKQQFSIQLHALEENLRAEAGQKKKIILKTADKIHLVDLKDIITCESDSCYTYIHTTDGEKIFVTKTLKEYEEMLESSGFYRVHKSFLVNFEHIRQFDKQDGGYVILTNKLRVPVSFRKRDELLRRLENMAR